MAPLAHTLALLAMTVVATATIKVLPLDMAENSFDDQYLKCSRNLAEDLLDLQVPDFCKDEEFFNNWKTARTEWRNWESFLSRHRPFAPHLSKDEIVALMAYTMKSTGLYSRLNNATCEAGNSSEKYRNEFPFKSLHFLLTRALQKLNPGRACQDVYRGVRNIKFNTKPGKEVRFGYFASTSLSETVARGFGQDTMFKVYTCHGADIQKFSYHQEEKEVLIPPFETFEVIDVSKKGNTTYIELRSTRNFSNYDCEWLKGGSITRNFPNVPRSFYDHPRNFPDHPRNIPDHRRNSPNLPSNSLHLASNSPHLGGLLLATVAMAVVTGTL